MGGKGMLRKFKLYLKERKRIKEIQKIVQEKMRSLADQREHLELNKLLRDPNGRGNK
jgi:hypothetical protein